MSRRRKQKVIFLFLVLLPLFFLSFSRIPVSNSSSQTKNSEGVYGDHALNLTVTYHALDVKNRQLILGMSGNGIGIGDREQWKSVGWTSGFLSVSWGSNLTQFKIFLSPIETDNLSAIFNFQTAYFGLDTTKMVLYPHDFHKTWFELYLVQIAFHKVNLKVINFINDFSVVDTKINNYISGNGTVLQIECSLHRTEWAQMFLLVPVFSFYLALILVPLIRSEGQEWFSKRFLALLSIITFSSINLYGVYGSIQHSYGPSIFESNLALLLIGAIFCLILSTFEDYLKENGLRKTSLVLLLIPFCLWIFMSFVSPKYWLSELSINGKIALLLAGIMLLLFPFIFWYNLHKACQETELHAENSKETKKKTKNKKKTEKRTEKKKDGKENEIRFPKIDRIRGPSRVSFKKRMESLDKLFTLLFIFSPIVIGIFTSFDLDLRLLWVPMSALFFWAFYVYQYRAVYQFSHNEELSLIERMRGLSFFFTFPILAIILAIMIFTSFGDTLVNKVILAIVGATCSFVIDLSIPRTFFGKETAFFRKSEKTKLSDVLRATANVTIYFTWATMVIDRAVLEGTTVVVFATILTTPIGFVAYWYEQKSRRLADELAISLRKTRWMEHYLGQKRREKRKQNRKKTK